jgi:hypothetical protein
VHTQNLSFCTSKASKLSAFVVAGKSCFIARIAASIRRTEAAKMTKLRDEAEAAAKAKVPSLLALLVHSAKGTYTDADIAWLRVGSPRRRHQ